MDKKIKVLFVASNPFDTSRLKLDEEMRSIMMKIRASEDRDSLELFSSWATRADDLLQAMNIYKPEIVHFSGHGNKNGEIILTSDNGQSKPVSKEALFSLFKTLKDNIRIVIINACNSQVYAKALTEVIDCVIAMKAEIDDLTAILFAASFYRAIGFGRSVAEAFEQGITSILLENASGHNVPELYTKDNISATNLYLKNKIIEPARIEINDSEYDNTDFSTNLGYGISLEASAEFLGKLRVTSSDWGPFETSGLVRSGWLYHSHYPNPIPNHTYSPIWLMQQNLCHAFTFFKIHLMFNGTGYIHLMCASNRVQSITLKTNKRFEKTDTFSLDKDKQLTETAVWTFSWNNTSIQR